MMFARKFAEYSRRRYDDFGADSASIRQDLPTQKTGLLPLPGKSGAWANQGLLKTGIIGFQGILLASTLFTYSTKLPHRFIGYRTHRTA